MGVPFEWAEFIRSELQRRWDEASPSERLIILLSTKEGRALLRDKLIPEAPYESEELRAEAFAIVDKVEAAEKKRREGLN